MHKSPQRHHISLKESPHYVPDGMGKAFILRYIFKNLAADGYPFNNVNSPGWCNIAFSQYDTYEEAKKVAETILTMGCHPFCKRKDFYIENLDYWHTMYEGF